MSVFSCPIRIYWEDTDAGGIVYYANYFRFMERARTEWLRSLGVEQEVLRREHSIMFVVVNAAAEFLQPARYADMLQASCQVQKATPASLTFQQEIVRDADAQLLVSGSVRVACLDAANYRPRPLPAWLCELIAVPVRGRDRAGGIR